MKRRKRKGMSKARPVPSRASIDAGSLISDISEPLRDQAHSSMARERQLATKQRWLLEQASKQAPAVSTPEKLVALLDRIAEARARSTTEGRQTARKPGF